MSASIQGDGLRIVGVDLAGGPDQACIAFRDCMLGRIDGFRIYMSPALSPVLLRWPARLGRRARAGSARSRKRALHAAGMRHGRTWISRKILPPWVGLDELPRLLERAGRDVEADDLSRSSPDGADALAFALSAGNNPFRNTAAETSGMANPPAFRRTSGSCICATCGKEYRRHPHSEDRDWNGDQFLNVLCNGDLVKL